MAKSDYEGVKSILQELDKNKFSNNVLDFLRDNARKTRNTTMTVLIVVLVTLLLLNLMGKLTVESNGWILAALIGYLFGRGQTNLT